VWINLKRQRLLPREHTEKHFDLPPWQDVPSLQSFRILLTPLTYDVQGRTSVTRGQEARSDHPCRRSFRILLTPLTYIPAGEAHHFATDALCKLGTSCRVFMH
jgi:hypothetical protein